MDKSIEIWEQLSGLYPGTMFTGDSRRDRAHGAHPLCAFESELWL
jgi:hypothetical protein